jgi:hypothetical protein
VVVSMLAHGSNLEVSEENTRVPCRCRARGVKPHPHAGVTILGGVTILSERGRHSGAGRTCWL